MSYVSGFMMGAAIGKSIRQMFGGSSAAAPSDNPAVGRRGRAANLPRQAAAVGGAPSFALVSTLPGRRRYRAARIAPSIASLLEERLAAMDFVKCVKVNAVRGSILIEFDEKDNLRVDGLAAWMKEHLFASSALEEGEAASSPDESHAGRVTRSVRNTGRAFSAWINRHTAGWFDMSSLVSLLFALRGLRKVLMTYSSPSGAQMLWWALSLMRGWRTV